MGRAPCCDKANVKKGPWSPEEDATLKSFIDKHGTGGNWIALPNKIGLKRCGKSCRLRWLNYLRPNIKHGGFTEDEENVICSLYVTIGSRWSIIAAQLPGRTDNDIKNYWNTRLKKKFFGLSRQRRQQQPQQQEATNNNLKLLHHNRVICGNFCSPYYPQPPPLHPSNFTLNEEDIPIIAPFEEKNMCIIQHDSLAYDTNIWGSYVEGTCRASDCFDCVQEGQISTFMNDTPPMHWGGDFEVIPMEEEMVHLGPQQMQTINSSIITTREEHGVCHIGNSSVSGYEARRKNLSEEQRLC